MSEEIPALTLGEASKSSGIGKPTLSKAIAAGKLAATRGENGSWQIDPAELERFADEFSQRARQPKPVAATVPATDFYEMKLRAELAEQRLTDLRYLLDEMSQQRSSWEQVAKQLAKPTPQITVEQTPATGVGNELPRRPWWPWRRAG